MKEFPRAITLPESVKIARLQREQEIVSSAKRGIFIRLFIITIEFLGFAFLGSQALLADALASLVDVVSTFFLVLFVKLAERPPDKNHPFGHGRLEPLIGMQLGTFLAILGSWMLFQQLFEISNETREVPIERLTWIIPVCAVLLLELCYRFMMRTAKKQNSPALAADAVHYRIDALTSLFAAIALILAAYFPGWSLKLDHMGAIAIACTMILVGLIAAKKNLNQLLDKAPSQEYFDRVKKAASHVQDVLGIEKIRIQLSGPDAHVDIDVEVDPKLSVDKAHCISQKVRAEIQKEWAAVRDVTVHIEPYYENDH
ncbi:MAG TPA: cation diffusion facilitator family transporter [Parachlamydiaceae bacterium]|nr:cation diffusion facilitator family transporter [Parachlamydiaceae bacterium]